MKKILIFALAISLASCGETSTKTESDKSATHQKEINSADEALSEMKCSASCECKNER